MTALMEGQRPVHTDEALHKALHPEVQLPDDALSRSSPVICL